MKKKIYIIDHIDQLNNIKKKSFFFYSFNCKIKDYIIKENLNFYELPFYKTQSNNYKNQRKLFYELKLILNNFNNFNKNFFYLNFYQISNFLFSVKTFLDFFYFLKKRGFQIIVFKTNIQFLTPYNLVINHLIEKKILIYQEYYFKNNFINLKKINTKVKKILKTLIKFFLNIKFKIYNIFSSKINILVLGYVSKEINFFLKSKKNKIFNYKIKEIDQKDVFNNIFLRNDQNKSFLSIFKEFNYKKIPKYLELSTPFLLYLKDYAEKNYKRKKEEIKNLLIKNEFKAILSPSNDNWISKLYAEISREIKIKFISVQHGGTYGNHDICKNETNDFSHSEYFFSYSRKNQINKNSIFKSKVKIIPVGYNFDLIKIRKKINKPNKKILLIFDNYNGINSFYSFSKMKPMNCDFYDFQKKIIEVVKNIKNQIEVRTFPNFKSGIENYLLRNNFTNIKFDNTSKLSDQIDANDVIITDSLSDSFLPELVFKSKKILIFNISNFNRRNKNYIKNLNKVCTIVKNTEHLKKSLKEDCNIMSKSSRINFLKNYSNFNNNITYYKKFKLSLNKILNAK